MSGRGAFLPVTFAGQRTRLFSKFVSRRVKLQAPDLLVHGSNPMPKKVRSPQSGPDLHEPRQVGTYLLYRYRGESGGPPQALPRNYTWSMWRAYRRRPWPGGECDAKTKLRFFFRFVLYRLDLFANSDCGALCIFEKDNLVHYSAFSPRYWRFPFLRDTDLQIGNTWTEPSYRAEAWHFSPLYKSLRRWRRSVETSGTSSTGKISHRSRSPRRPASNAWRQGTGSNLGA